MGDLRIRYEDGAQRYEMRDGHHLVGFATAIRKGGVVSFPHVEIDPEFRGKDCANRLVRAALDDVRIRGERIVALCPFVVAFLRRNPTYRDLIA